VQKNSRSWVGVPIFTSLYLESCDFAMDSTKEHHQILCISRKECHGEPGNDQTSVPGKEHEPYRGVWTECSFQGTPQKAREVKSTFFFTKTNMTIAGLENREYDHKDPSRWPRGTLCPQTFSLTSPTSGGRSVGIVHSRTQATAMTWLSSPNP
jgi:hypothetical protein